MRKGQIRRKSWNIERGEENERIRSRVLTPFVYSSGKNAVRFPYRGQSKQKNLFWLCPSNKMNFSPFEFSFPTYANRLFRRCIDISSPSRLSIDHLPRAISLTDFHRNCIRCHNIFLFVSETVLNSCLSLIWYFDAIVWVVPNFIIALLECILIPANFNPNLNTV